MRSLFIRACGIAVRSIAPHVKDKLSDVPVLVADEAGQFVIPLLAGHYGEPTGLPRNFQRALGATAVLTTATDVNGLLRWMCLQRQTVLPLPVMTESPGVRRASARRVSYHVRRRRM